MMKVALHVTHNDGSGVDVEATAPDLIAFERHFDKPFTVFADSLRLEYLLWLSWETCKRRGQTDLDFDPWCETVDSIVIGDSEEPAPLEKTAPTGS